MSLFRRWVGLSQGQCCGHVVTSAGLIALATVMWACSSAAPTSSDRAPLTTLSISGPFTLAATAMAVRDPTSRLQITVIITNTSNAIENVEYGGCWSFLRLYKTSDVDAAPVFDEQTAIQACATYLRDVSIPAGGSTILSSPYDVPSLLVSGVPAGRYFVGIAVAPNGTTRVLAAGQADVQP